MVGQVFEYAIVITDKNDEGKEIKSTIIKVDRLIAKDQNSALMSIGTQIPTEFATRMDDIEIRIRVF